MFTYRYLNLKGRVNTKNELMEINQLREPHTYPKLEEKLIMQA